MSESAKLPMNFGGIYEEEYSSPNKSRVLIFPVSYPETVNYGGETSDGAIAIIDASRNLELYDEETDSEVFKIGIHTLEEFPPSETPEIMMDALYRKARELLRPEKFICSIGGEHSISVPLIRAHAEKFHNLSVLQIDARADLRDADESAKHSNASVMVRVIKEMKIPAVQIGIRSMSAKEARLLDDLPNTKIFWARDIVGKFNWIDNAVSSLTENVYLTIDLSGLDPGLVSTTRTPEPGGLGWYETLALFRKLAEKRRIVGMDLVEFAKISAENNASAFLCAKLIYKTLSYIFHDETPKIRRKM